MTDIFKQFSNCLKKEVFNPELGFNSFIFCRWLSGNSKTLGISNFINMNYKFIPDIHQYNLVRETTNIKFIKFPSFKLDKIDTSELMKKYNISYEKSLEYLEILKIYEQNLNT